MTPAHTLPVRRSSIQVIGYIIIGIMVLCTTQSLGELGVMYPVNGAFFAYSYRFIDRAWG
jgi:amino acid transporter